MCINIWRNKQNIPCCLKVNWSIIDNCRYLQFKDQDFFTDQKKTDQKEAVLPQEKYGRRKESIDGTVHFKRRNQSWHRYTAPQM